jgi:hypothetical protein
MDGMVLDNRTSSTTERVRALIMGSRHVTLIRRGDGEDGWVGW